MRHLPLAVIFGLALLSGKVLAECPVLEPAQLYRVETWIPNSNQAVGSSIDTVTKKKTKEFKMGVNFFKQLIGDFEVTIRTSDGEVLGYIKHPWFEGKEYKVLDCTRTVIGYVHVGFETTLSALTKGRGPRFYVQLFDSEKQLVAATKDKVPLWGKGTFSLHSSGDGPEVACFDRLAEPSSVISSQIWEIQFQESDINPQLLLALPFVWDWKYYYSR